MLPISYDFSLRLRGRLTLDVKGNFLENLGFTAITILRYLTLLMPVFSPLIPAVNISIHL